MDMVQWGTQWQSDMLAKVASQTIVYWRGITSYKVTATVGKTDYNEVNEYNMLIDAVSIDFITAVDSLPFKPEVGDFIIWRDRRYNIVTLPGDSSHGKAGQNTWNWSGSPGIMIRIHTKEVA